MRRILYFDQNAWIALAQGAWDRKRYPAQNAALKLVCDALLASRIIVPLSFANIYETAKINDPQRRAHLARVQATISRGIVLQSRRRILEKVVVERLCAYFALEPPCEPNDWFLSDLFFEAGGTDIKHFGHEVPAKIVTFIRENPAFALFDYLTENDDAVRLESVRRYSAGSAELIARIETRRKLFAGESFALRRRAYCARLFIDEIDFFLDVAKRLGLNWSCVRDIGAPLVKSLIKDVPVMNVECELSLRLEDQMKPVTENDLRDMMSFAIALPLVDTMVAEKPFVNMARQAQLNKKYDTQLLTSVTDLTTTLR